MVRTSNDCLFCELHQFTIINLVNRQSLLQCTLVRIVGCPTLNALVCIVGCPTPNALLRIVLGGIRVRIPQELDVVAFWSWNLDVVAFCLLKNCLRITMSCLICLRFSMLWCFSTRIWCRRFFVLESRWRGFLVLESRCRGICASAVCFRFH